jgi:hypothetical protein
MGHLVILGLFVSFILAVLLVALVEEIREKRK